MTRHLILLNLFLVIVTDSFSQSFLISEPDLAYDGSRLSITYDLKAGNEKDLFYIWVEIRDTSGNSVHTSSLKGEFGEKISPGNDKTIIWLPAEDSVLNDVDVTVEILGEKYETSFKKGSALITSAFIPGLGLSKIREDSKWWLMSIPVYGAVAGGLFYHFNYLETYEAYSAESEIIPRNDLFSTAQKQSDISAVCFISAAAIWIVDMIWVAASPKRYKPLRYPGISLGYLPAPEGRVSLISFKIDF
ncbi:MAG: hypothetical protein JXR66_04155 [Bacteroidales bacterium]|nr:hypothetical protein [Bacteroidales bacterium]